MGIGKVVRWKVANVIVQLREECSLIREVSSGGGKTCCILDVQGVTRKYIECLN